MSSLVRRNTALVAVPLVGGTIVTLHADLWTGIAVAAGIGLGSSLAVVLRDRIAAR